MLHSFGTLAQLAALEGATLRAPAGEADDRADSYALALAGVRRWRASPRVTTYSLRSLAVR